MIWFVMRPLRELTPLLLSVGKSDRPAEAHKKSEKARDAAKAATKKTSAKDSKSKTGKGKGRA